MLIFHLQRFKLYIMASAKSLRWASYSKTKGRSTMKGEWFEIKTAALLYLRGLNSKQEFQLGSNVAQARNFDDIVLKYKPEDDPNTWHTCFMQLKHKERAMLNTQMFISSDSGGFSLRKYLASFSEIKKKMGPNSDDLLFAGGFENCDFVIYTNASMEGELANRNRRQITGPVNRFLTTATEKENIVSFCEYTDQDIYRELQPSGPEGKEFLQKLKVFTGQPSESQMNELIKEELKISCAEHKSDVDIIYRFFIDEMQDWWSEDSVIFLNKDSDVLENSINQYKLFSLTTGQKQKYRLKIRFQDFCLRHLKNEVCCIGPLSCVVSDLKTLKLSSTKVMQILREEKNAYIFVGLDCLLSEQESILSGWRNGRKRFLVVVSESGAEHADLCTSVCAFMHKSPDKRFVLIHSPGDMFAECLKKTLGTSYEVFQDSFEVSQLEKSSNDSIIKKDIQFQGYHVTIKSMFNGFVALAQTLIATNLSEIVNTKFLSIGEPWSEQSSLTAWVLKRHDVVKNGILSAELPPTLGLVTVTGLSDLYLRNIASLKINSEEGAECGFLPLPQSTAEEEYRQLSNTMRNIHWLEMTNVLQWRRSQGGVSHIKKYIDSTRWTSYSPRTMFDIPDRIVLIAIQPGEPSLMAEMAATTKASSPSSWVLHFDISSEKLAAIFEATKGIDMSPTVFLMMATQIDEYTPLARDLFRFSIEISGNVVVLVDGMDDVAPSYRAKTLNFLTGLFLTKVSKIWITTKESEREVSENLLSTISFSIDRDS